MIISCPSKTFLFGEYLALSGSESLLVSTAPRFQLKISKSPELKINFHKDSPGGRLAFEKLGNKKIELCFIDPYDGSGGFGASSAQFLLVNAYLNSFEKTNLDSNKIWSTFRSLYKGKEILPSGMDMISQFSGEINQISFSDEMVNIKKQNWPFEDYSFFLFKTNQKINTHEHLNSLNIKEISSKLEPVSQKATEAFNENKPEEFFKELNNYYKVMLELDLVSNFTREKINSINKIPGVLTSKGCGALGADVIAVFCKSDAGYNILGEVKRLGLDYMASENSISGGLKYENMES